MAFGANALNHGEGPSILSTTASVSPVKFSIEQKKQTNDVNIIMKGIHRPHCENHGLKLSVKTVEKDKNKDC